MKNKLFGLAAVASVSLALLTGCPAEDKQASETTTTTTTTTTATGETATGEGAATGETAATGGATTTTTTAAAVDAKAIFAQKCAGCHGANGGGGMGPALGGVEAKGDDHIRNIIANGSPEKGMPAFAQQMSEAELTAMVDYVKSL